MYELEADRALISIAKKAVDARGGAQALAPDASRLSTMSISDLLSLREEVTKRLPPTSLKDMDMEQEILVQYHTMRSLQGEVLNDEALPLNQRVAVANAVATSLGRLSDMQIELYSSERFKGIENLLVRHLNVLPEETAAAFLADYSKLIGGDES